TFVPNVAGLYVVQLIVNDGFVDSAPATVSVVAQTTNQAPVVSAGSNQTITLPTNFVFLTGTASDDGLPNNTLTTSWATVSGPGPLPFPSPSTTATEATFSAAGTYVLQLSANDSALTTNSTVTVVVNPLANSSLGITLSCASTQSTNVTVQGSTGPWVVTSS